VNNLGKNIFLVFSLFLLAFGFASACTTGETRCVSDWQQEVCTNSQWEGQLVDCPLGCDYATNACFGSGNGDLCPTLGAIQCDPNVDDQLQICKDINGRNEWAFYGSCGGYKCDKTQNQCFVCDSNSKPYCNKDLKSSNTCNAGYWKNTACASGYVCNVSSGVCEQSGVVVPFPCATGATRCSSANSVERCSSSGLWVPYASCFIGCYAPNEFDAYCKDCTTPSESTCFSTAAYHVCNSGYKYDSPVFCAANQVCSNGACVSSQTGCNLGEQYCLGSKADEIWTCVANNDNPNQYNYSSTCPTNTVCTVENKQAYCRSTNNNNGGGGGSSGGSSYYGTSSGGGEVFRCSTFSDWQIDVSASYNETNTDGKVRTCTNTTLKKWCVKSDGKLDSKDFRTNSTSTCSEWSDACTYEYQKTEKYEDTLAGQCRNCTKDIFVYTCKPSGKIYSDNLKESVSCSGFNECTTAFAAQDTSKSDGSFWQDYGILIGFILLLIIAIIAFFAWRMAGSDGEENEGNANEGNAQV